MIELVNPRFNIFDILGPVRNAKEDAVLAFRLRNLKIKEGLRLFLPFVLIFVVGFVIRARYPLCWFLSDGVMALGDALMVAGIVGGLIDLFAARILIEKVSDDLAEKLVGRGLPKELQAHIRGITKTKLVLGNYTKRYALSLVNGAPDRIEVTSEIAFEVRNYSDVVTQYSPYLAEESFYSPVFKHIEYGLNGEKPCVFDGQKLADKTETTPDDRVKRVYDFEKIKVPPFEENRFVNVLMRYNANFPLEYTDLIHLAKPATNVRVIVETIPEGFQFQAEGEGAIHNPDSKSWDFRGPFVGGQHVRVRWFKTPSN